MIQESPRQKLFRLTQVYLKEQYAAHILHCLQKEYAATAPGITLDEFIGHWYARNGYTRVCRGIRRLFPEADDQILRESPALWEKYLAVLARREESGGRVETALRQLCGKPISEGEIEKILDTPEEDPTDLPRERLSAIRLWSARIKENLKGVLYRLTHWQ